MTAQLTIHQPRRNKYPGTIVVEPGGFNTTEENAKHRRNMTAALGGITIVGMQRQGTNTKVFDLGMKQQLHPTRYDALWPDHIDELRQGIEKLAGSFDRLIGHGMSAGSAPVLALAKLGMFERVLFRDGVYLPPVAQPESALRGMARFLLYQTLGERHKPNDPNAPFVPKSYEDTSRLDKAHTKLTEIRHYRELMLSRYTADGVWSLAQDPNLPLSNVLFGHSFTSANPGQAAVYNSGLMRLRQEAIEAASTVRSTGAMPSNLIGWVELNAYHSDLLRPDHTARHIGDVLALSPAIEPMS